MHFAERLAVDVALRHDNAARYARRVHGLPVDIDGGAKESRDGVGVVLGAGDVQLVAYFQRHVDPGVEHFAVAPDMGADKLATEELAHLTQGLSDERGILHDERHAVRGGVRVVCLGTAYLFLLLI